MSGKTRKRYPGTLQRRGDSYRLHVCVGGDRHYFTFRTSDRRKAEHFARVKHGELEAERERKALGLPSSVQCSALFDRFEELVMPTLAAGTQAAYKDSLKPIRAYFVDDLGDPAVERVRAADVTAYLKWRRVNRYEPQPRGVASRGEAKRIPTKAKAPPAPLANRTLAKDRAVLHRIFALADQLELREGNPVARVAAPKSDSREIVMLDDAQYERLVAQCDGRPMLRLYVLVLAEAGLRCESEALRLQWDDVDLKEGFLRVTTGREGHRTKSGKGRWVPMTPRLAEAMREHFAAYRLATYAKGERTSWVFHHSSSRTNAVAGQRIGSLRHAFTSAAKRAKLPPGLHQHDLRHRRVTTWLAGGANPVHVKEAMGHSDLRTTMIYTHLVKDHLRSLVAPTAPPAAGPVPHSRTPQLPAHVAKDVAIAARGVRRADFAPSA